MSLYTTVVHNNAQNSYAIFTVILQTVIIAQMLFVSDERGSQTWVVLQATIALGSGLGFSLLYVFAVLT